MRGLGKGQWVDSGRKISEMGLWTSVFKYIGSGT